jgi:hypothetical protein
MALKCAILITNRNEPTDSKAPGEKFVNDTGCTKATEPLDVPGSGADTFMGLTMGADADGDAGLYNYLKQYIY